MKKLLQNLSYLLALMIIVWPVTASAILSMELTQGVAGAIPLAIVPFENTKLAQQDVSAVITNDLQNSGRFKIFDANQLSSHASSATDVNTDYFRKINMDNVVVGSLRALGSDRFEVKFQLLDILRGQGSQSVVLSKTYTVNANELRKVAHHISDLIYQKMTDMRGIFSTKLAYVVVQRGEGGTRYLLEVADQDGYNPRSLLVSKEPIMSPSWSPNARQIAYVSFENKRASIYLQDVATGGRRLLSSFPGINGAPAWSPDGRKLALVLSKSGSPNIYVMNIATGEIKALTKDFYINTEPSWSPDGRTLLFTSNRAGGPQIYQVNVGSGAISRVSYDGAYNARASYTADGNHVVMIHRVANIYNIAILDLDNGTMRVLNKTIGDSTSPSVAPNGSMILYDTYKNGRNVLGMVSADGRVQLMLPARNGEAQDPAWSPYIA